MDNSKLIKEGASRYEYIMKKLCATLQRHGKEFPELETLQRELEALLVSHHPEMSYFQKLTDIRFLLKEKAVSNYIIRHIHHNFSEEVTLFENGAFFNEDIPYYLQIP